MLMEEPLPELDEIIKRLNAVILAEGVMNDSTLRHSGKSSRSSSSEATVHSARTVSGDKTCWKCGQKGHDSKVCTATFQQCSVKGCLHRAQHCSKMHTEVTKYFELRNAKKTQTAENKMLADVKKANCIPVYEEVDTHMATIADVHSSSVIYSVDSRISTLSDDFFFSFELQQSISQFNLTTIDDDHVILDDDIYCSDIAASTIAESDDDADLVCYVTSSEILDETCIHGDTASQITLVNDVSYLTDVHPIRNQLCVVGIDKSRTIVTQQGLLPGFEELGVTAAVLRNGNGHVLSIPQVVDNGFHVTIDADNMCILDIHDNIIKMLPRTPNGMWGCPLLQPTSVKLGNVQNVDRNFTRTQIER